MHIPRTTAALAATAASLAIAVTLAAALAPAAVHAHGASAGGVTVAHPWARATPGGATVGAAYMEITAAAGAGDRLVSASSPVAGRVELHTHTHDGGVMRMRKVDAIAIPPGGSAVLKPMGDHVMLIDLKQPLKEGDLVAIRLVFEKAGAIDVEATVEPLGAMGAHGMGH
jgi:hypothetical protein